MRDFFRTGPRALLGQTSVKVYSICWTFFLLMWVGTIWPTSVESQIKKKVSEDEIAVENAAKQLGGFKTFSDSSKSKQNSKEAKKEAWLSLINEVGTIHNSWDSEFSVRLNRLVFNDELQKRYRLSKDQIAEMKLLTRNWIKYPFVQVLRTDEDSDSDGLILPTDLDIPFTAAPIEIEPGKITPSKEDLKNLQKIIGSETTLLIDRESFQAATKFDYLWRVEVFLPLTKTLIPIVYFSKKSESKLRLGDLKNLTIALQNKLLEENRNDAEKACKRMLGHLPTQVQRKMKILVGNEKTPALMTLALTKDAGELVGSKFHEVEPILIFNGLFVDQDYTYGLELTKQQIDKFLPELKRLRTRWTERQKKKLKNSWSRLWKFDQAEESGEIQEEQSTEAELPTAADFNKEIKQFASRFQKVLTSVQLRRLKQMNARSFCTIPRLNPLIWPFQLESELGFDQKQRDVLAEVLKKEARKLAERYQRQDEKYFEQIVKTLPKKSQKELREFLKPVEQANAKKR